MEKKVLNINGVRKTVIVDSESTLVDVLRRQLGLTGTKVGCGTAQCGACSVIIDGRVCPVLCPQNEKGRRRGQHHHHRRDRHP